MKGQTLIEVLIALSIAVVIVTAVAVSVLSALNNAQFTKNQNMATQYVQEGMEIVRNIRNSNWDSFKNLSGAYCLDKNSADLIAKVPQDMNFENGCPHPGVPPQNLDIFARQVNIEYAPVPSTAPAPCSNSERKVTVLVSWASGKCTNPSDVYCHSAKVSSCFNDVVVRPTP